MLAVPRNAYNFCCITHISYCRREIVELKELLESQTEVNASLQRRLQDKQDREDTVQQVY